MLFLLALKDLKFEKLMSLCIIASIASILTPLLLLFSLRTGVLTELERDLTLNPANLEITFGANYTIEKSFIDDLKTDPNVGFAVPLTRSLDVSCDVRVNNKVVRQAMAVPTADGDPVLIAADLPFIKGDDEIYISESLADKLEAKAGDTLQAVVSRKLNNQNQNGIARFTIKGIVPRHLLNLDRILISVFAVACMEDYRDGYEPLIFSDGSNQNTARTAFAKIRLYAKDIYAVEPLVKRLESEFRIYSKLSQIEEVKAITRVLNTIFEVIAAVTVTGGILCLTGLTFSALQRKVKSFSMLRLMGLEGAKLHALVLIENFILTLLGFALAIGLCFAGAAVFNAIFKEVLQDRQLSLINAEMLLVFAAASVSAVGILSLICTKVSFLKASIADILRME